MRMHPHRHRNSVESESVCLQLLTVTSHVCSSCWLGEAHQSLSVYFVIVRRAWLSRRLRGFRFCSFSVRQQLSMCFKLACRIICCMDITISHITVTGNLCLILVLVLMCRFITYSHISITCPDHIHTVKGLGNFWSHNWKQESPTHLLLHQLPKED